MVIAMAEWLNNMFSSWTYQQLCKPIATLKGLFRSSAKPFRTLSVHLPFTPQARWRTPGAFYEHASRTASLQDRATVDISLRAEFKHTDYALGLTTLSTGWWLRWMGYEWVWGRDGNLINTDSERTRNDDKTWASLTRRLIQTFYPSPIERIPNVGFWKKRMLSVWFANEGRCWNTSPKTHAYTQSDQLKFPQKSWQTHWTSPAQKTKTCIAQRLWAMQAMDPSNTFSTLIYEV